MMLVTRRSSPLLLAVAALLGASACHGGKALPGAASAGPASPTASKEAPAFITPSFLLPDFVGPRGVVGEEGGAHRVLLDRMRAITRDDGSIERASELLPTGALRAAALPSRFGGGYLFHATSSTSTHVWRAPTWLAKLEPLTDLPYAIDSITPGLDRLYVKLSSNGAIRAIDATTGEPVAVSPLPSAAAYGALVFADGWRGVAETDLRGVLATFDAGATWRSLGVHDKVASIALVAGNPVVHVAGGSYVVDERGGVTFRPTPPSDVAAPDVSEPPARPPGPLGRRPLRAALEDGWPDAPTSAVVARGGALVRVLLRDGAVLATNEDAYPERQASCHAIRVGASFGFVCGERDGATAVYAFSPPLSMRPLLRYTHPRFVAASGNGALVVRGSCADDAPPLPDARPYCVRSVGGVTREIRLKGDVGAERVVALADGRVAVLVPPHAGAGGQILVLADGAPKAVPLKLPTKAGARELARGLWLEGFEERAPGVLGGWVEAGGTTVGVKVGIDGGVIAGQPREDPSGLVVSGRFALSVGESGRAAESMDGGMTFRPFDMPERDDASVLATPTRACGPVGCALGGWLRVGWGKPENPDDLAPARAPKQPAVPLRGVISFPLSCEVVGSVTPPPPDREPKVAAPVAPPPVVPPRRIFHGPTPTPPAPPPATVGKKTPNAMVTAWAPFRNMPPPAVTADETGVDNGTTHEVGQVRAYAWGKRGADWTRAGRWLVRFDDRFDTTGGVRSTATTASPWPDEAIATESVGTGVYPANTQWGTGEGHLMDPSGRAAIASACRGSACALYALAEGQPVQQLRDAAGRGAALPRPLNAVRVGETWFFLLPQNNNPEILVLERVDLGVVRTLSTYHRPSGPARNVSMPMLVRRARSHALGLLIGLEPEPGAAYGSWAVMPVNQETGELGEPVPLVRKDLGGKLERCSAGQDGWLYDTETPVTVPIDVVGASAAISPVELRLRLDPGFACVESMATRIDGVLTKGNKPPAAKVPPPKTPPPPPAPPPSAAPSVRIDEATAISLSATERATNRRWSLRCGKK